MPGHDPEGLTRPFALRRTHSDFGTLRPACSNSVIVFGRDVKEGSNSSSCGAELLEMIRRIAPGSVIPAHTASPKVFAHTLSGPLRVHLPEPCVPLDLFARADVNSFPQKNHS